MRLLILLSAVISLQILLHQDSIGMLYLPTQADDAYYDLLIDTGSSITWLNAPLARLSDHPVQIRYLRGFVQGNMVTRDLTIGGLWLPGYELLGEVVPSIQLGSLEGVLGVSNNNDIENPFEALFSAQLLNSSLFSIRAAGSRPTLQLGEPAEYYRQNFRFIACDQLFLYSFPAYSLEFGGRLIAAAVDLVVDSGTTMIIFPLQYQKHFLSQDCWLQRSQLVCGCDFDARLSFNSEGLLFAVDAGLWDCRTAIQFAKSEFVILGMPLLRTYEVAFDKPMNAVGFKGVREAARVEPGLLGLLLFLQVCSLAILATQC